MKMTHHIHLLILAVIVFKVTVHTASAATSSLWDQYVEAKSAGTETTLPDFSYAGYHNGEDPIPTINWKVFDVTEYGAIPNDGLSDKTSIQAAIDAAEANGSGIISFPPGRFCINEPEESHPWVNKPITVESSNIVFRGSGSGPGGTELYGERHMNLTDEEKLWTAPYVINFKGYGDRPGKASKIIANSARESYSVMVANAGVFRPGDWALVHRVDNSTEAIAEAVAPHTAEPSWTSLINNGVVVDEIHLIESIDGNEITFKEPIHSTVTNLGGWSLILFDPIEEVGVQDIAFVGNWKTSFRHHVSYLDSDGSKISHDSAWSALSLHNVVNSWIRNCRFTDWNAAMKVGSSANVSVMQIKLDGNPGHNALTFNSSSHCFAGMIDDAASQWHACGVAGRSSGNVIWKSDYGANTCFESHASQPRHTLLDNVSGGWMYGRLGGAVSNLPNHLENLVLWNYHNTGEGESGIFEFMRSGSAYYKVIMPFVIGFHGNPQSFDETMMTTLESNGTAVEPESLFEAQFKLRTGKSFTHTIFAEWAARHGLSDPVNRLEADPDKDSLNNLVEYAIGSIPAPTQQSAKEGSTKTSTQRGVHLENNQHLP